MWLLSMNIDHFKSSAQLLMGIPVSLSVWGVLLGEL